MNKPLSRIGFLVIFLMVLFSGCQPTDGPEEDDRLLAKVHNKSLYLSELDGMFPEGTGSEDSSLIINAFSERWIRDALMLHEAERNIPSDLNIDKLVRAYRASLIRHNYEKAVVEELLDSSIAQAELIEFYEKHKEQYQLETPIVRCHFIRVPLPVPDAGELRRLWNSNRTPDKEKLVTYCNKYAEAHILEDSTWYRVDDLAMELPKGALTSENVSSLRDFSQRDENYQYYFKVFELKNKKEVAPLSFIEDQARKVILRNRKDKLLQEKIEDMYDLESRRNNIKTYTN